MGSQSIMPKRSETETEMENTILRSMNRASSTASQDPNLNKRHSLENFRPRSRRGSMARLGSAGDSMARIGSAALAKVGIAPSTQRSSSSTSATSSPFEK